MRSLPTRGAWIETYLNAVLGGNQPRRSPHGERGLKLDELSHHGVEQPMLPTWGHGLKRKNGSFRR